MKFTPLMNLVLAILIVTALTVILIMLKMDSLIPFIIPLVFTGLIGVGLIPAASRQSVSDISNTLANQIVVAVSETKSDLIALHEANAHNIAAVAQTVAVHAALIPDAPAPPPLIQSTNPPVVVVQTPAITGEIKS